MRQLIAVIASCLTLGLPGAAAADGTLSGGKTLRGWEAVGRLNISGRNMCTGALVAPNLVVTAAHCLFDPQTGARVNPRTIKFEAGLNGRQSKAARQVDKAVLHPNYRFGNSGLNQMGNDLAVLRLAKPISRSQIQPFATAGSAERGDTVGVMSYSYRHATRPSLESACRVLARQSKTLVMSCRVDFGASGSPVFEMRPGRAPRLVSVISAKAAMGNRRVSLGSALDGTLVALMQKAS